MTCIKCGKEIMDGSVFCRYCGAPQADDSGSDDETVLLPGGRPGKASEGEKTPDEAKLAAASVSKKKNLLPFLIGGIAAVVVLAVLIFAVSAVAVYNSPEKKYDRQLSLAERYLDDLDYEKAIAAYKAAIEIDPINPEAYKALAELYLAMDDSVSAQETVKAGINASGDVGLSAMLTEITSGQNTANVTNETVPEEPQISEGNVTVKVMAANETGAICSAEVKLTGAAGEFSGETDSDGKVSFSDLEYGEYTVKCDAEGFHKREMTVNVSGTDVSSVVALVPDVVGDDAYVLLTWNGEHDLDLCAFNTEMKEYVNIGHPIDSAGNVFLYADHGADMPYEVIYLHNASAEIAKTLYVADAGNARKGSSSQMEADGVTILVYDSNGLIYESTADTSESAPLWCPCYYYAGTVYDQQDYIYDTTGEEYAWISFDEKDAVAADAGDPAGSTAQDDSWKTAYKNFLESGATPVELFGGGLEGYTFSECKYSLIYIDSDDIPEICVTTPQAYLNWSVLTYQSGQVYSWGWNKGVTYVPRSGKFVASGGMMGHEDYTCYRISTSGIIPWKEGYVNYVDDNLNDLEYGKEECGWDGREIIGRDNFLTAMKADCGDGIELDYDAGISYSELMALLSTSDRSAEAVPGADGKWKQAYRKFVDEKTTDVQGYTYYRHDEETYFALVYLDDDDVPELLYSSSKDFGYGICTYSNGKVTEMGIDSVDTIHVLPETGYCYIESAAHFSGGETVYKLEKGVFKEICREYHYVDVGEDEYYVNGLETTESEYDSVHSRIPTYDRAMIFGSPYSELNRMYFSDGISVMTYVELTEALSK